MYFKEKLAEIYLDPKRLFLIDTLGALLSAFLLGVVLVELENLFGIPHSILYFLALVPIFFAIYDFLCYIKVKKNIKVFLKIIGYTNILYCCISIGVAFFYNKQVTYLGWIYILVEVSVILTIATIEIRTANRIKE